jgi:hypothetical protein
MVRVSLFGGGPPANRLAFSSRYRLWSRRHVGRSGAVAGGGHQLSPAVMAGPINDLGQPAWQQLAHSDGS